MARLLLSGSEPPAPAVIYALVEVEKANHRVGTMCTAILKTIELSVDGGATLRVGWQYVYGCSFKLYLSCC